MESVFDAIYQRVDSNTVWCTICDLRVSRRLRLSHWQGERHKQELNTFIESELSRFENYLVDEPLVEQAEEIFEPMDMSYNINFVASRGAKEHIFDFADHSWKLRLDEDDVASTITIELNDYIENNTYVVLDATVNINVKFGENDNVQKNCPILYTHSTYPVSLLVRLGLQEGTNVAIQISIQIERFELVPVLQGIEDDDNEDEQQVKRGRPAEFTNYKNLTTKLWLALFYSNRGVPFSANTLQQIFDIVYHVGFRAEDTPRTKYIAFRCDDFFFDRIPASMFKFGGTDEVITYYKPKHVLEYVLKNEDLTKDWVSSWSDDYDHPSSSEGWKIIQDHFQPMLDTQNALLILVALWIDGFVGELSRNKSYTSISMTFANFPNSIACRTHSRFCITNIPPSLNHRKKEFIDKVIIKFLRKLENKELSVFEFQGTRKLPVGALHAIKGDHMSKIELAGVVAPSGKCSSFYTTTASALFFDLRSEFRTLRNPDRAREQIELIGVLTGTEKTAMIQQTGLNGFVSPFWSLALVAKNFFQRFAICDLHQLFIGIVKNLACCFGLELTQQQRLDFNQIMQSIYPAEGYARLTMNVFREGTPDVNSLKGDMWLTFAAQSIIMFKRYYGHLHVQQYRLWKTIMNGIIMIVTKTWTRDELQPAGKLENLVYSIRKSMVDLYPNADWSFPNFETMYAIPYQIAFLGPLHFQSTARDEEMNRRRRQILQVSNGRQQANFLTRMVENQRSATVVPIENNDGQVVTYAQYVNRKQQKQSFADYDLIIPKEPTPLNPNNQDMRRIAELVNNLVGEEEADVDILSAFIIDGFCWHNKKVKSASAQSRKKRIKEVILVLDFDGTTITGLFTKTFIVNVKIATEQLTRYYTLPFLSMRPIRFTNSEKDLPVREGTILKNDEFYPCGWSQCTLKSKAVMVQEGQTIFVWD